MIVLDEICGDLVPGSRTSYCTKPKGHGGLHATSGPLHTRWSDQQGRCELCDHPMHCHDGGVCLYGCSSCNVERK